MNIDRDFGGVTAPEHSLGDSRIALSGQNPELPITSEEAILLTYNRETIGLFAKVRQGFSRMSELASHLGREIKDKRLEIAGGILLTAAAAASACDGGSAEGETTNNNGGVKIEPVATATSILPEPSPTPRTRPAETPRPEIVTSVLAQIPKLKEVGLIPDENSRDPNDRNTAIDFKQNTLPLLESSSPRDHYIGRHSLLGTVLAQYYSNRTWERYNLIKAYIDDLKRQFPDRMAAESNDPNSTINNFLRNTP